jgi:dTDP-4-dehydrorhamnose reductase
MKSPTISIIGASGYIGQTLYNYFDKKRKYNLIGTYYSQKSYPNLVQLNVTDGQSLANFLISVQPDLIIYLSCIKDLDICENNEDIAYKINTHPIKVIISTIRKNNLKTKIIFFSSNYVFKGDSGPYQENDPRLPLTVYGKTKKVAEDELLSSETNYTIVRTSTVVGSKCQFVKWMKNNINSNRSIEAYSNIMITPTPIIIIPKIIQELFPGKHESQKIIHLTGNIQISRFQLASIINKALNLKAIIQPTTSVSPLIPLNLTLRQSEFIKKYLSVDTSQYLNEINNY